ncbi:MAG: polysaccharide deacetylase family protein [Bacteroidota bacterium]
MMFYFVKTPSLIKKIFPSLVWDIKTVGKNLYLTFDDGPHPIATNFVLDELKKYDAKATFFCLGKNVVAHPDIYKRILDEGHKVGNHTFNHLNGRKVKTDVYFDDIKKAAEHINSNLFRPPYGRITFSQLKSLKKLKLATENCRLVMWDILSGDFDKRISPKKCATNVIQNSINGSIIVFHDSEKALERLQFALPEVLKFFSEKGYKFRSL